MATINFKLRTYSKKSPPKTESKSIYLIFSYGRKKELRYSTGLELKDRRNWKKEEKEVNVILAEPNAKKINKRLRKIKDFIEEKYDELLVSQVEINNQILRNELDLFLGKKKTAPSSTSYKTLLECYKWYFEHFSRNPLPTTKKPLASGTIKSYKTSFDILKEFNDEVYALSYDKIMLGNINFTTI
jgi:hypothetical protein